MNAPPTAAEYRAALEAVLEGLDIPHAKTAGDDEARSKILAMRITHVKLMVDAVLTGAVGTPAWVIGYYREQLAKNPATGYHPSTAPIAYGQHEACAACGHRKGSHWEVAEPDGERRGCAYLGCTCTAYDDGGGGDEAADVADAYNASVVDGYVSPREQAAAVLAASIGAGTPLTVTDNCAACGQPRFAHSGELGEIPGLCDAYDPGRLEDAAAQDPDVPGDPFLGHGARISNRLGGDTE